MHSHNNGFSDINLLVIKMSIEQEVRIKVKGILGVDNSLSKVIP